MFSLLNFFLVSGSIHILDTAAPEVAASFSLRASNHSRVTGGRLAIFRFRLYLAAHQRAHRTVDVLEVLTF